MISFKKQLLLVLMYFILMFPILVDTPLGFPVVVVFHVCGGFPVGGDEDGGFPVGGDEDGDFSVGGDEDGGFSVADV
ncbi:hypothetical protein Tco_0330306, partial [Tanacetum coccineum]